jgi:hypothetical protein
MPFTWLDVSSTPGAYIVLSSLVWLNIADFGFKAGFRVLWPIVRSLHAEMIIGSRGNVAALSQVANLPTVFAPSEKVPGPRHTRCVRKNLDGPRFCNTPVDGE